jgi:hypothetical protein
MAKKKTFKALRCKHMPAPPNTVIIFSTKHGDGSYQAGFTIGNQDFTVAERETKAEASWYCDMLEHAFNALIEMKDVGLRSPKAKELYKEMSNPNIKIINKK